MKNKPKRSALPASSQMHVPDVDYESFARSVSSALSIDPSEFKRASARSSKHLSRILANPQTKKRLRKYCRDLIAEDKLPPNGTPRT